MFHPCFVRIRIGPCRILRLVKTRQSFLMNLVYPALGVLALSAAGCGGSGGSGSTPDGGGPAVVGHDGAVARDAARADARAVNSCTQPITATWSVDGVPYVSDTTLYFSLDTAWQLTLLECVDDGVDRILQFSSIPGPIAVGTYPLSYQILHANPANGNGGAFWASGSSSAISADTNYYTDDVHTGSFSVTAVDPINLTYSATFSFTAVNDAGTKTVQVTDGVITNAKYSL